MKKIILIGGGGHCLSCLEIINSYKNYKIIGVIDNMSQINKNISLPYLGNDNILKQYSDQSYYAFITIGQIKNSNIRKWIFSKLIKLNFKIPVFRSKNALISKSSIVDNGTIIMHNSIINSHSKIGKNCIINTSSIIEHESVIEDNCHISTNAVINGNVFIKKGTFIGSNAVIKEGVTIGENSVIGAGSVIKKNVIKNSLIR